MASHGALFMIFVLIAEISPLVVQAKQYVVGDNKGWTTGYDYQAWAKGKVFRVGDQLIFKYPVGAHNVFKVNGPAFKNCTKPPANQALKSGNDTIELSTAGRKWYICGVANHCKVGGQKLVIDVQPAPDATIASPSPSYSVGAYAPKRKPFINFFGW